MNARQELLRRRLGQSGKARAGISRRPDPTQAPLTSAQRRMWLHQQMDPGSSAYNVSIRMDLRGALDEARLMTAIDALVQRHEVLRTTYPAASDGQPVQKIHPSLPYPLVRVSNQDPAEVARQAASTPFNLAHDGPFRLHLVTLGEGAWSLILTVHHIIWDGGCFGIFSQDLAHAYAGTALAPLPISYADIAYHQTAVAPHDPMAQRHQQGQADYWTDSLTPLPPVLPLPTSHPFSTQISERACREDRLLPTACAQGLRDLAARLQTTPFAVFIAAYGLLLARWSGESDITLGTMVSNRHLPGSSALLGNFGNTVLLRLALGGQPTFRRLVAQVGKIITGALSNADLPFEDLIRQLAPPREAGHGFFTDCLGLFLDRDIGGPQMAGVTLQWENVFNGASPFALTFQGFLTGDRLQIEATYRSDLFSAQTIGQMVDHLEAILCAAMADPDAPYHSLAALPAAQSEWLNTLGRGAPVADTNSMADSVLAHWRRWVAEKPDAPALIFEGQSHSYRQLDQRANHLAARLIAQGVRRQDVVGVALDRSPETLIAPIALWKCGAVTLPLDPSHPPARLSQLLTEAKARLVISHHPPSERLDYPTLCVTADQAEDAADPGHQPHPLEAAHIGFTSGSTGRPKGVINSHRALTARCAWVADHWPSGTRLAKSTPTAIDATAELCEACLTGEPLVLASNAQAKDALALAALLQQQAVGHLMAVPGLIDAIATAAPSVIASRQRVLSTGEPLLPSLAAAISQAAPGVRLFNSYGCTETAGDVAAGPISPQDAAAGLAPIGTPLPGSHCLVLGPDLDLAPPGVLGELYIASPQLALGYLGHPALTAARFVAAPDGAPNGAPNGARLYRTGDLARWRADGRLELAGRSDDQVNVRGHRVEPAETVEALLTLPQVAEAAVLPRRQGSSSELIAYVSGPALGPQDGPALRQEIARSLPSPLVPAQVLVLPQLPRLAGGKVDRQALAALPLTENTPTPAQAITPPQDPRQATLATILAALLDREAVGADQDFFALGGDSLLAVTYAARAAAAGMPFAAAAVFQYPTIAQLAAHIPQAKPAASASQANLAPQVHRFRLSGLAVEDFVTWAPLGPATAPEALAQALAQVRAQTGVLGHAITARGRLWRPATATAGDPPVLICQDDALFQARAALDLATGQGLLAVIQGPRSLLVAHPALIDGLSLDALAAQVRRLLGQAPTAPLADEAPRPDLPPADWDALVVQGAAGPWWIGPQDQPPPGPYSRLRTGVGLASAETLCSAFLSAVTQVAGQAPVLVDVERPSAEIGPLFAVPTLAHSGESGSSASYRAWLEQRRPSAGGPGLLLRRSLSPEVWQTDTLARGADRLYRLVAGWQQQDDQTVLEVSAADTSLARDLAAAWANALSTGGVDG